MFPIMAAAPSPRITLEEIKMFYKMDRDLFTLLTKDLWRDPNESMQVMALWHWLEQTGLNNVVQAISSLPHFLINEIADEAKSCIKDLTSTNPFTPSPEQIDLSLTQSVLGADVSSNFLPENRGVAILGINKALSEICLRALTDLLQDAIKRNAARTLAETQIAMSSFIDPGFSRLNINNFDNRGGTRLNPRVNRPPVVVQPDDRTMFVTFSKGYPVPEPHIREFFNLMYGDCIEALCMQDVPSGEQSLYARVVFYTPNVIKAVLNGVEKAKFTIKGRHMWMRKFVPKRRRPISPPGALLQRPGMLGAEPFQGL